MQMQMRCCSLRQLLHGTTGYLDKIANVVDLSSYFDTAAKQREANFWPLVLGI